jgi:hypothetical protein
VPIITIASASASDPAGREKAPSEGLSALGTAYAALAAIIGASAAARLAAPALYVELASRACPSAPAAALLRLTGATLLPVAAALWTLKVQRLFSHRSEASSPAGWI